MMNGVGIDKKQQRYIIKKMINIVIRATYYIFCWRNRNWDSADLMQFWFFFLAFVLFCFCFCFFVFLFFVFFLFNNPISSSICKLPIRSKIYNCTFKNTNKVAIIIIITIIIIIILIMSWSSLVLWYFLGIVSHVSAASHSLETQHFPQDMFSTKDAWQLCTRA